MLRKNASIINVKRPKNGKCKLLRLTLVLVRGSQRDGGIHG